MRLRDKKRAMNRRALSDIRLAKFIVDLNRTVEEAYFALDNALGLEEGATDNTAGLETRHGTATHSPS